MRLSSNRTGDIGSLSKFRKGGPLTLSTIINEVNLLRYFTKVKKNQYFLQEILFTCNEVNILLNNYFFTLLLFVLSAK